MVEDDVCNDGTGQNNVLQAVEGLCNTQQCRYDGLDCDPCEYDAPVLLSTARTVSENIPGVPISDPISVLCHGRGSDQVSYAVVGVTSPGCAGRGVDADIEPFRIEMQCPSAEGACELQRRDDCELCTAQLYTSTAQLDHEACDTYMIALRATGSDQAWYSEANVTLTISNVDDLVLHSLTHISNEIDSLTQLSTTGGDVVVFTGLNFGYAAVDGPVAVASATYRRLVANSPTYRARSCTVTTRNTRIECEVAPGIGKDLHWELEVDGITDSLHEHVHPLVSYAPPKLAGLSGAGAYDASTAGGQVITISGSGFGPARLLPEESSAIYSKSPGSAGAMVSTATACRVLTDTEMICMTVPGTGRYHRWRLLNIGGQDSRWSAPLVSSSYGPPTITSFSGQGAARAPEARGRAGYHYGEQFRS